MEPELFSTLTQGAYLLGGFFDFLVVVALIVVALVAVRPVEAPLGYAIAALAGTRFLCVCTSRSIGAAFDPIPFHDMNGAVPMVLLLLSFVQPFVTLGLWGVVIFATYRLGLRVAGK